MMRRAFTTRAGTAVIATALAAASIATAHAQGFIYVSAWQADSFTALGGDLRGRLAAQFTYDLGRVDSDADVLRKVRADPRSIGFVQRDLFATRLKQNPSEFDRLEFYGDIAACMVVVTRKGAPYQSYDQLVAPRTNRKVTLDVGPAGGRVASTFAMLGTIDPDLGNLDLEHRGGARALSRVVTGDTDAALIVAYAPFHAPELDRLVDQDAVDLVPFFSRRIAAASVQQRAPYALKDIELGTGGWFQSRRRYQTTCSTLGVVVHEEADARLSEAVAQAMLPGSTEFRDNGFVSGLFDLVSGAATRIAALAADLGNMIVLLVSGERDTARAGDPAAKRFEIRLDEAPPAPAQRDAR
jgi:hypothetical protein